KRLERGVVLGDDAAVDHAEVLRQRVGSQSYFGDDSKGTAASAAQRPEQILILATIRHHQLSVGSDYLGFEHAGRGDSIFLGPTTEAAALQKSPHGADRSATPALDVPTVLHRYFLVRFEPPRASLQGDAGSADRLLAPAWDERLLDRDPLHLVGPHQQRAWSVGTT